MSCIVYQTDKRTGIKYAYESVSYWDKDKKQPKSKRKYLGRVDPQTGEILTSRRKKSSPDGDGNDTCSPVIAQLRQELSEKDLQIDMLQKEMKTLSARYKKAEKLVRKIAAIASEFTEEANV